MKCNKYFLIVVFCITITFNIKNQENKSYWQRYAPQRLQNIGNYMIQQWSNFYNTMILGIKKQTDKELIEEYNQLWKKIIEIVGKQDKLLRYFHIESEIGIQIREQYNKLEKEFDEVIEKMSNVRKEFAKDNKDERLNKIDFERMQQLNQDSSFYKVVRSHIYVLQLESKKEVLKAAFASKSLSEAEKKAYIKELSDIQWKIRNFRFDNEKDVIAANYMTQKGSNKELIEEYNKLWKEIIDMVENQAVLLYSYNLGSRIQERYKEIEKELEEIIKKMSNVRKEFIENDKDERLGIIKDEQLNEIDSQKKKQLTINFPLLELSISSMQLESREKVLNATLASKSLSETEKRRIHKELLDLQGQMMKFGSEFPY